MKHSVEDYRDMAYRMVWLGKNGFPAFAVYLRDKMDTDEYQERLQSVIVRRELGNRPR